MAENIDLKLIHSTCALCGDDYCSFKELPTSETEQENFETELIWLGNEPLQGCIACYKCRENLDKMLNADGIIPANLSLIGC